MKNRILAYVFLLVILIISLNVSLENKQLWDIKRPWWWRIDKPPPQLCHPPPPCHTHPPDFPPHTHEPPPPPITTQNIQEIYRHSIRGNTTSTTVPVYSVAGNLRPPGAVWRQVLNPQNATIEEVKAIDGSSFDLVNTGVITRSSTNVDPQTFRVTLSATFQILNHDDNLEISLFKNDSIIEDSVTRVATWGNALAADSVFTVSTPTHVFYDTINDDDTFDIRINRVDRLEVAPMPPSVTLRDAVICFESV